MVLSGDWTLSHYTALSRLIQTAQENDLSNVTLDVSGLTRVDTAGASLLVKLAGSSALVEALDNSDVATEQQALITAVASAMEAEVFRPPKVNPILGFLADIGQKVTAVAHLLWLLAGFIGETLSTLFYILPRPSRWRFTSFVAAVHDTGLNALPIVALLTFLVGSVVAFLGATVLQDFGATIYTVNLVAFSFLREFGVLLAAILLAGRTASSFTAHIGAMKVNEELDAIRTLGLNPVELLVVPRVLAMMVSLPVLTFVGMISGLIGGAVVCAITLDIPPSQYMAIVERDIGLTHFLVGIGKAPVFAFLIAVIGCLEGFKVSGSAQSVGEHTTSSVVQSIFMVILLDSIAALFFMEMGW
ncbi:MlaE family lipid ABC transporter permease subunit [Marinobacter sp.]|uniref:ABC transporter permease n=1 Tax=Marinobacter sp. TaxID=50741 RepID=UPI002B272822|nr:MlaE family lipid ABC transporter permease subunit [Marinobacter sp.]